MGENILFEIKDKIAIVTLNRAEKKNALTKEMIKNLISIFEEVEWKSEDEIRFLVLRGNGNFFCSGADLTMMMETGQGDENQNVEDAFILATLFREVASLPFPVIAEVKGGALAGAMGLLASSDYVVAEEGSIFGTPEVKVGLIPAVISLYLLRKIGYSNLARISLSGEVIGCEEALKMGLVQKVVVKDSFDEEVKKVEDHFLTLAPKALRRMKNLLLKLNPLLDKNFEEFAAMQIAEIRATLEAKEGIEARKEKRDPNWIIKRSEDGEKT